MILLLALFAQSTVVDEETVKTPRAPVTVAAAPAPLPPQDWTTLPVLRFAKPMVESPALSRFVRGEVANGRCTAQRASESGYSLTIDIAVLLTPQGIVRRTIPRAIGCPSVEQYAAGLAFSRSMGNVVSDGATSDGWYRTSMVFTWPG